jgi:hypothetical protein
LALHGNIIGFTRSPGRLFGGTQGFTRGNYTKAGGNRSFINASAMGVSDQTSIPDGITFAGAWVPAQVSGGMSSRMDTSATLGNADLAMGLAAAADLNGSGDVTSGLSLIVSMIAAITASGSLTADMLGVLALNADLAASGDMTAAMTGLSILLAEVTGSSTTVGNVTGPMSMEADINVTGATLTTANVAASVWGAIAEGTLSYADLQKILLAIAAGKSAGFPTAPVFRDTTDSVDRVTATLDGDGNRITVTIDLA